MAKRHAQLTVAKTFADPAEGRDFMLSPEERRIIKSIVAGYTYADIARQFSLGASTISRRTGRLLGKLGVANKLELVFFAINHGIVRDMHKGRA